MSKQFTWQTVAISSFLTCRQGKYKPESELLQGLKRLSKIDFSGNIHLSDKPTKTDMIIVQPHDLVISGINVAKGAIAVHQGEQAIAATIHYSSYTFDEQKIDVEYFKRFLQSPVFIETLQAQTKGGIKTEIKPKQFLPLQIQLPSLDEQRKIVQHFQSFEVELHELNHELAEQKRYFTTLRQAILQDAIEGKLTVQWRAENPVIKGDPNTDAHALLAQIHAEKQSLIAQGKLKKDKPLAQITDDEKPFELPVGWVWVRLGTLLEETFYGPRFGTDEYIADGIPTIRTTDMNNGVIELKSPPMVSVVNAAKVEFYRLRYGDILITRTGSIGEYAFFDGDYVAFPSAYLIRCRLMDIGLLEYILRLISSPHIQRHFGLNTQSGTKPNINSKVIENSLVPLPSMNEQTAIVEKVQHLLAQVDALEAELKTRQQHAEQLMQSVLREAFHPNS